MNFRVDPEYSMHGQKTHLRILCADILWYLADHGGRVESDFRATEDLIEHLVALGHPDPATGPKTILTMVSGMVKRGQLGRVVNGRQTRALWIEGDTIPPRPEHPELAPVVETAAAVAFDATPIVVMDVAEMPPTEPEPEPVPVPDLCIDGLIEATPHTVGAYLTTANMLIQEAIMGLVTLHAPERATEDEAVLARLASALEENQRLRTRVRTVEDLARAQKEQLLAQTREIRTLQANLNAALGKPLDDRAWKELERMISRPPAARAGA